MFRLKEVIKRITDEDNRFYSFDKDFIMSDELVGKEFVEALNEAAAKAYPGCAYPGTALRTKTGRTAVSTAGLRHLHENCIYTSMVSAYMEGYVRDGAAPREVLEELSWFESKNMVMYEDHDGNIDYESVGYEERQEEMAVKILEKLMEEGKCGKLSDMFPDDSCIDIAETVFRIRHVLSLIPFTAGKVDKADGKDHIRAVISTDAYGYPDGISVSFP